MKKFMIHTLMIFLALSTGPVFAKQTNFTVELADSLVWKITGPELEQPSYLAGTLHLMCKKDFNLDQRYQHAIDNTQQLYLELDFDDPESMNTLQQGMFVDKSLKDRLSNNQYQQLNEYLQANTKLNLEMLDKLDFFAIQATLLASSLNCPIKSVDHELMTMALSSGQEVWGLETAEEQLEFSKIFTPPKSENAWTEEEFNMYVASANTFDNMLEMYQEQDITELHNYVVSQSSQIENGHKIIATILDNRNIKWVEKMPDIMKTQPTFFAVGSGHLAGDFGVINLLRQAGYTVTPVMQ